MMSDKAAISLLAISGSLRPASSNTAILRAMAALAPPLGVSVNIYDGLGDLPHFSPERDAGEAPVPVARLRGLLKAADGVILCTPEYAFGMPGVLKNALDWTVSSGEWDRKPVVAISASPLPSGGEKALQSLLNTLSALSVNLPAEAVLSIPAVYKKMDEQGAVTDAFTLEQLGNLLVLLLKTINEIRNARSLV